MNPYAMLEAPKPQAEQKSPQAIAFSAARTIFYNIKNNYAPFSVPLFGALYFKMIDLKLPRFYAPFFCERDRNLVPAFLNFQATLFFQTGERVFYALFTIFFLFAKIFPKTGSKGRGSSA